MEALQLVRSERPEIADAKLSYAGRLDPMATGLVVVLHGSLLSRQEEFWHLPKAYDVSVVLGLVTDTYDMLGLPTRVISAQGTPSAELILSTASALVGKHTLPVPLYSSHRVDGRPLFQWAREGRADIETPVRVMAVAEVSVHDIERITPVELHDRVRTGVHLVRGDFRQNDILAGWEETLASFGDEELTVVRLSVSCNAGTYIRSLAHVMGKRLGTGGTLLELRRVRVGRWHVDAPGVIRAG